jgi:Na+/H+-dicarboxylate symporter
MSNKTGQIILIGMLIGVVLGVLGGIYVGDMMLKIKFLGALFLNALKLVAILLIIFSMIVGVASLGDVRRLGRTALKTMAYFMATTGVAVILGIILVNIIRPGAGVERFSAGIPDIVAQGQTKGLIDIILSMVPANIFQAATEGQILGLIVFSLVLGAVLTTLGNQGRMVIEFFDTLNKAIMKIVQMILYFAPIGVLALIGGIVAENQESLGQLTSGLGLYTLTVVLGLIIHGAIILPIILKIFGKQEPFKYLLNMGQAFATAFTTASSSATLPLTMEAVIEKNKIDKRAGSFVLPLGATINMDGTALYEAVAAIFIAQIYGIDLSIGQQFIIFITATLASIGAAGIPHAGTVTMVFVLSAVGLPIEGIGLIWAVDWFLDRCRTTVNIWGDAVGAAVIAETEEIRAGISPAPRIVPSQIGSERVDSRKPRYEKYGRHNRPEGHDKFERPERPERHERPDKPHRAEKQERTERQDRPAGREMHEDRSRTYRRDDNQKRSRKPEDVRSAHGRGQRHDRQPQVKKEPPIPKETIERDLERITKQLAGSAGTIPTEPKESVITPMEPKETLIETPKLREEEKKEEKYFDADFSKIDFFGGGPEEEMQKDKAVEKTKKESTVDTESAPERSEISGEESSESHDETDDKDDWGRSRKKFPKG